MKLINILVGIFFSLTAIAQNEIPMTLNNGVYYMPCRVNGLGLNFIFDTGASNVSISSTEALFMLKNNYLSISDLGESIDFKIANGDIQEGTKVNLKEVEIGGTKLYNIEASVVHSPTAPLLLGQSVLSKLGVIQFNYQTKTLRYFSQETLSKAKKYSDILSSEEKQDFLLSIDSLENHFNEIVINLEEMNQNEKREHYDRVVELRIELREQKEECNDLRGRINKMNLELIECSSKIPKKKR